MSISELVSISAITRFKDVDACEHTFLGLKPWFHYLEVDPSTCDIKNFNVLVGTGSSDITLILVAIIDDLIRVAGFIAIGYIIYGGIQYITSQGSPDQTAKAQATIQNALVGLVIVIVAITLVGFIGNKVGGS